MADFSLLRVALVATSPAPTNRSLTVGVSSTGASAPAIGPRSKSGVSSLYPVFAAVAALLVLALIAGNIYVGDEAEPAPTISRNAVVVINGTPFTPEDNDAEFGAASSDVMNGERDDARDQTIDSESDDGFFNGWSISLILALTAFAAIAGQWARRWRALNR